MCSVLVACPICGMRQSFASAVERTYDAVAGGVARRIVEALNQVASRRNANLAAYAQQAWRQIERAVHDARKRADGGAPGAPAVRTVPAGALEPVGV